MEYLIDMTREEKEWYNQKRLLMQKQSEIRTITRHTVNSLNKHQMFKLILTTSEKHQTTNIKEFQNWLNDYFKNLSEKLKIISIVTCNKCGYLYCNCLLFFEHIFNFDINVLKRKWRYGNVYIQHYVQGLNQNDVNSIANCFADDYKEIRVLKDMSDNELILKADEIFKEYTENLPISDYLNALDKKTEMLNECYENFCELKEQQAENKVKDLFQLMKINK